MCGIFGIRRFGEEQITEGHISALLIELEKRGNDASGLAIMNGEKIHVFKAPRPAWDFVASTSFKEFLKQNLKPETDIVIGHTRFATQGDPAVNINNHPLYAGQAAVVHNGMIHNDDFLFKEYKIERKAETDSDIIRGIVDNQGISKKTIRALERMSGSCAAACISPQNPGQLLLLRSGSPLVLASTPGLLMWASTKEALHLAQRQWHERFGLWMQANRTDVLFTTVHDDTALIFDNTGLVWHQKFSTCSHYVTPTYEVNNPQRRAARQERWKGSNTPASSSSGRSSTDFPFGRNSNSTTTTQSSGSGTTESCTTAQCGTGTAGSSPNATINGRPAIVTGAGSYTGSGTISRPTQDVQGEYIVCRNPNCPQVMDLLKSPRVDGKIPPLWQLKCPVCAWSLDPETKAA